MHNAVSHTCDKHSMELLSVYQCDEAELGFKKNCRKERRQNSVQDVVFVHHVRLNISEVFIFQTKCVHPC